MGSRSNAHKHVQIDGNSRDGALFAESVGRYVGTRRTARGKFEERVFEGKEYQVKAEWRVWRDETVKRESIHVERKRAANNPTAGNATAQQVVQIDEREPESEIKENPMATKTQPTKSKRDVMYVLSFKAQRTTKNVALFGDMDAALRMADSLTVALEVTGTDGEYDVTELEVWG